jgi:hypothetical protein
MFINAPKAMVEWEPTYPARSIVNEGLTRLSIRGSDTGHPVFLAHLTRQQMPLRGLEQRSFFVLLCLSFNYLMETSGPGMILALFGRT